MKRILFLILWAVPVTVYGAVEIYADGHKYASLQAYQEAKKAAAAQTTAMPASLNTQQEDYVRKEAQRLGINVDFSKIKTFQVGPKISPATLHKLYVLGVEKGVAVALQNFYDNWGQSSLHIPQISSRQLQGALQEAVTATPDPKLLITEPGKVRIMSLTSVDGGEGHSK